MFRVVKKLKALKKPLNRLNWKNGDLFKRVLKLKEELKHIQVLMEANPHCNQIKEREVECLEKYMEVVSDEEKFLFQKAKIEWLQNWDKNSKFFHKVIQSKRQMNRILSMNDEYGNNIEGNMVASKFVEHFKKLLSTVDNVTPIFDVENLFVNKLKLILYQ